MRIKVASLVLMMSVLSGIAWAGDNFINAYVLPSEKATPQCVEFCKKYGVEEAIINARYLTKGEEKPYKKIGVSITCGWMPWKDVWTVESPDAIADQLKSWCTKNLGPDYSAGIDAFEIDEPNWGYGDWKNQSIPELEKDAGLRDAYYKEYGCWPTLSSERFTNPEGWRNTLRFRQQLFADRFATMLTGYGKAFPGKSVVVALSPVSYESGSQMGIDIHLLKDLPQNCRLMLDPYFQATRRPLQWSGYMLRWFTGAMDNRPLNGITQFYHSFRDTGWPYEGYMELNPDDASRQTYEYLMNGSAGLTVFAVGEFSLKRGEHAEALGRSLDFARENKHLWQNTRPVSQVGIYFSENTFRMKDMWGPWSRMTGLYGASFQTEYTYYALSHMQIPADIVSVPFGDEKRLPEKLKGYSVIVLPDVKCMSKYEADSFNRFVKNGGTLIVTGEAGLYDECGRPRTDSVLGTLISGKLVAAKEHKTLNLANKNLPQDLKGLSLSADYSDAALFRRMADRYPDWLREKCSQMKFEGYKMSFPEKLPKPAGAALISGKDTRILAAYDDGTAAITVNSYGKGKVYFIGPNDITLFQGSVTDSLEEPVNRVSREARCMRLFNTIMQEALEKGRLLEVKSGPAVEVAMRRKMNNNGKTLLYFLNHGSEAAQHIRVRIALGKGMKSADLKLYQPGSAPCKLSGRVANGNVEFALPSVKEFAAVEIN